MGMQTRTARPKVRASALIRFIFFSPVMNFLRWTAPPATLPSVRFNRGSLGIRWLRLPAHIPFNEPSDPPRRLQFVGLGNHKSAGKPGAEYDVRCKGMYD
jgi:hypothetical protein